MATALLLKKISQHLPLLASPAEIPLPIRGNLSKNTASFKSLRQISSLSRGHEVKHFSMTQAPSEGGTRKEKSELILPSAVNQEAVPSPEKVKSKLNYILSALLRPPRSTELR